MKFFLLVTSFLCLSHILSGQVLGSSPIKIDTTLLVHPNCQNENGAITVFASGGKGTFQFSIDDAPYQASNTFSGLQSGDYLLKIIDQRGCEDSILVSLIPAISPVIDTIILHPATCGETSGSLEVFGSGEGTLRYALDSMSFQSSGLFTNLNPDRYEIYVVDAAGCVVKDDALIDSLASAGILLTEIIHTSCGKANGMITVTTDIPNHLLYSIDGLNFQVDNEFTGLDASTYEIIIQDANGCHDTLSVNIAPSAIPVIDSISINPETCQYANGSLLISASGGAGSYLYSIDGNSFQLAGMFPNLSAGQYNIQIMDEDGCSTSSSIELTSLSDLQFIDLVTEPTLCGQHTGVIKVGIEGGVPPITISLNNGAQQTGDVFTELAAGNYTVQVMDAGGCSIDTTLTISQTDCPIYIPNIFSPNGDGTNDYFQIQTADKNEIMITRFFIFDRWGNNVYERFNLPLQSTTGWWDGTYKRFTMNTGVFTYYIEVEFSSGDRETYKGSVTLIR